MEKQETRGRPKRGKETRETRSIRLEPQKKDLIVEKYGTVQNFVDEKVEDEFGGVYVAEIVPEGDNEVSLDDF